ncbi:MAG TPA: hypothetical protein VK190_03580 [Pseudoneobacillus sp.]|nr:hypothetical protein [Pseudoneobacillus sp.]
MTYEQEYTLKEYCCTSPCRHHCRQYNCGFVFDFMKNISIGYGLEELLVALKFYTLQGYENNAVEKFLETYGGISWNDYMRTKDLHRLVVAKDT